MFLGTKKQKRKYQAIWVTISLIAIIGMVIFLIIPLFY